MDVGVWEEFSCYGYGWGLYYMILIVLKSWRFWKFCDLVGI